MVSIMKAGSEQEVNDGTLSGSLIYILYLYHAALFCVNLKYLIISYIGPVSPEVLAPELSRNFLSSAVRASASKSKLSLVSFSTPLKELPPLPLPVIGLSLIKIKR